MFESSLSDDGYLCWPCKPGQSFRPDDHLLVVSMEKGRRRYLPCGNCVPRTGEWFAVNTKEQEIHFGMADLLHYSVDTLPHHAFQLGFFGSLRFFIAHLKGVSSIMQTGSYIRAEDVMIIRRTELRDAVSAALQAHFGSGPLKYSDLNGPLRQELTGVIDRALFDPLFQAGLCMIPGSLRIEQLSVPAVSLVSTRR